MRLRCRRTVAASGLQRNPTALPDSFHIIRRSPIRTIKYNCKSLARTVRLFGFQRFKRRIYLQYLDAPPVSRCWRGFSSDAWWLSSLFSELNRSCSYHWTGGSSKIVAVPVSPEPPKCSCSENFWRPSPEVSFDFCAGFCSGSAEASLFKMEHMLCWMKSVKLSDEEWLPLSCREVWNYV